MLKLLKFQNWTGFTVMQQASLPGVGTNWHTLKLVARGNRLAAHYDGSLVLSWTDPDAQPFLSGGVSLEMWTDATAYTLSADDVLVALPGGVAGFQRHLHREESRHTERIRPRRAGQRYPRDGEPDGAAGRRARARHAELEHQRRVHLRPGR